VSDPRSYSEVLRHLASHGFVVVAPQMYEPDAVPLGKPTTQVEARDAAEVIAWAAKYAPTVAGSAADPRGIGLAGHSRGGKVAWLVAAAGGSPVRALAGVDPVDGTGGPLFSAQPEALPAAATGLPPSSIIGMERGGACAPEGDNYRHFFERTTPPTRLALVLGHGHTDMLDPSWSGGGICFEGPARAQVRTLTGALLAAFFRQQLQGDETVAPFLESGTLEPLEVTHETR
jgi:chlorophyllase